MNTFAAVPVPKKADVLRLGYDDLVELIEQTMQSGCTALALIVVNVAEVSKLQARVGFEAAELLKLLPEIPTSPQNG
jgi:hypothetical protein